MVGREFDFAFYLGFYTTAVWIGSWPRRISSFLFLRSPVDNIVYLRTTVCVLRGVVHSNFTFQMCSLLHACTAVQ